MARIALVESFYTGSHKAWADQFKKYSSHEIILYTLPGKFWKWRMHGSAITIASKLEGEFDLIIVSDMIDLALFKSVLSSRYKSIPILLYFHENQLAYPWTHRVKKWDRTYAWLNYTSALVADMVCFSSHYNRQSFLQALPSFLNVLPDHHNKDTIEAIRKKSNVLPLGLDFSWKTNACKSQVPNNPPICLWNHRWEHDKNPQLFFESFIALKEEDIDFKLIVLGKSYNDTPDIFEIAKEKLSDRIIHFGYAESKEHYYQLIQNVDYIPVTSNHDFFGISVLEAVYAGARPLLPRRMAYIEHFDKFDVFYEEDIDFLPALRDILRTDVTMNTNLPKNLEKYNWNTMILQYDDLISSFCS